LAAVVDDAVQRALSGVRSRPGDTLGRSLVRLARTGARAGLLGTSRRADGRTQVTYRGHPLYYFVGDERAGDVKGEGLTGFGGRWAALT
jgi:hypothetical protein